MVRGAVIESVESGGGGGGGGVSDDNDALARQLEDEIGSLCSEDLVIEDAMGDDKGNAVSADARGKKKGKLLSKTEQKIGEKKKRKVAEGCGEGEVKERKKRKKKEILVVETPLPASAAGSVVGTAGGVVLLEGNVAEPEAEVVAAAVAAEVSSTNAEEDQAAEDIREAELEQMAWDAAASGGVMDPQKVIALRCLRDIVGASADVGFDIKVKGSCILKDLDLQGGIACLGDDFGFSTWGPLLEKKKAEEHVVSISSSSLSHVVGGGGGASASAAVSSSSSEKAAALICLDACIGVILEPMIRYVAPTKRGGGGGILLLRGCSNIHIVGSVFHGSPEGEYGICIEDCTDIVIEGCSFIGCGVVVKKGGGVSKGIVIRNCVMESVIGSGTSCNQHAQICIDAPFASSVQVEVAVHDCRFACKALSRDLNAETITQFMLSRYFICPSLC